MARCTLLLSALGLLGLGGCVDNGDAIVVILQNQVPSSGCSVPGTPTPDYQATGLIEGSSPIGYVFTPVLQNFSVGDGTDDPQHIAQIHGATVDVRFVQPSDLFDSATLSRFRSDGLTHFRVLYSGPIDAGGTASMAFEIVPAELLHEISAMLPSDDPSVRAQLVVDVSVDGSLGPADFQTKQYNYPIEVCNGCLITDVGLCSDLSAGFSPDKGGACNPFQDAPVECCVDGTTTVCPASPDGAGAQ